MRQRRRKEREGERGRELLAYQRVEIDRDGTEVLQALCESKQISCKCTSGAQSAEEMKAKKGREGGWKHKTQDETQQQNNFLSYLFTLSQSANNPLP